MDEADRKKTWLYCFIHQEIRLEKSGGKRRYIKAKWFWKPKGNAGPESGPFDTMEEAETAAIAAIETGSFDLHAALYKFTSQDGKNVADMKPPSKDVRSLQACRNVQRTSSRRRVT